MGDSWSKWANEEEVIVKELIRKCQRRFNVLVVGMPGVGKSSFLSSMQSCLTHDHGRELGVAGKFEAGESFTFRLKRYQLPDCGIVSQTSLKMPVFYDMPGLPDVDDDRIREILLAVLRGSVPINEPILVAAGMDAASIAQQYAGSSDQERDRIDRVVFVHSCQMNLPGNLTQAIISACNECDVVIFSVLTMADTRETSCTESEIELSVGTGGSPRGCKVELYHKIHGYYGRYYDNSKTNYYMLLMWKALLNHEAYAVHSNQD